MNENVSPFSYQSYKDYLRALAKNERGFLTQMAAAAGCERSYFSRVLTSEVHLTPDHGFRLSQFLHLKSREQEYFLLLVERDRSGDKKYQQYLLEKMSDLKKEFEDLSARVQKPVIQYSNQEMQYQSHWLNTAIHVLTSAPDYQTVTALAEKLEVSVSVIERHLQFLVSTDYVDRRVDSRGERYIYKQGAGHTPKNSPLTWIHHQNWRHQAVQNAQNIDSRGLHYTNVQTVSREDFELLKNMVLELIENMSRVSDPSAPEEMMVFACDFFNYN